MDVQLNALDKVIAINERDVEVVGVPRPNFRSVRQPRK